MKLITTRSLGLILVLVLPVAEAAMYRCERGGQMIISDKPCPVKAPKVNAEQTMTPTGGRKKEYEEPAPQAKNLAAPNSLEAAGETCIEYHAAMLAGDKSTLKGLSVAERHAELDQIPASSFSAMSKVMPTAIAVSHSKQATQPGQATVYLRATSGKAVSGTCSVVQRGGYWKVHRQDWN